MDGKDAFSKILAFLSAKKKIGGLEISDTDLKFAFLNGDSFETTALRLPPGVLEDGNVKDYRALVESLKSLRGSIPDSFGPKKTVNAVVTLSSVHVYTQVFSLPIIKDENLNEAIKLNINMVSPFEVSQAYAGWQLIAKDGDEFNVEVLSAFAPKDFIDKMRAVLSEAGFFPLAMESSSLSIARLIRERGVDFSAEKPILVLSIDDKGVKFLIIRFGQLHFEYSQSWSDIQGDAKNVSWENFEEALKRNLRQVINFYSSHWQEPLTDLLIASSSLVEETSKAIMENFSLNVSELRLKSEQPLRREWYEAVGAAMRGEISRADDKDINLFGVTVREEYRQQQITEFLKFWQVVISSSMAVLAAFMVAGYVFLLNMDKSVSSRAAFSISDQQMKEISSLQAEINDFNMSVAMISVLEKSLKPKADVLDNLDAAIKANGITVDRISLQQGGLPAVFSGEADSQDKILAFKNDLTKGDNFSSVNLNLSDIKPLIKGFSFTVSFGVK